jgi:uncharacterized delta-60 repeat protein
MRSSLTLIAASLGALLLVSAPAVAAPDGAPVRFWELLKLNRSLGVLTANDGAQQGGVVKKVAKLGRAPFTFPETNGAGAALDRVFSSADGSHYDVLTQAPAPNLFDPRSVRGGLSHLDELQAYRKRSDDATLRITISDAVLRAIDENLDRPGCPAGAAGCAGLRVFVRFQARAYAASADGDFFNAGGTAELEGHRNDWHFGAATLSGAGPAWTTSDFRRHLARDANASAKLRDPIKLKVPLDAVRDGELFAIQVELESTAINSRGGESTALGFIDDPQQLEPGLLTTRGLKPLGKPRFSEPKPTPPPHAHCPGGPRPNAGRLQLSRDVYAVGEDGLTPTVLVTRTGGSHGAASATVRTRAGSATAGSDFKQRTTRVRFGAGDRSPRLVEIPILEDAETESPETLTVSLGRVHCAMPGKRRRATVTILDDDIAAPEQRAFTVGGTVDGLDGGGLVLENRGSVLPVTGNGRFTFPGTFPDGSTYNVGVQTQPTDPDQVCSVVDGTGTVTADVSTIAVHCTRVATPAGLDPSFGGDGRVTTPGGGDARAVLIQPDGHIVAVGRRPVGVIGQFQFAAARYDTAGNLDHSFGTDGIATTSLGGFVDEANDAALLSGGGFVAVGDTDVNGITNADFGVASYSPDGHLDPGFGGNGFVSTDLSGRGDVATAVAVQPDGKIVAAGYAETGFRVWDFAVVRYNPDGALDHSFGSNGIVTTDLGTEDDRATDIALQPDGKIIAVGNTLLGTGLVRYLPDGTPDPTFGDGGGKAVSDIHTEINGVALTPAGTILIAGTRGGDIAVASYSPNGNLNLGFGQAGVAQADIGGPFDSGENLVLDSLGDIVVVGRATSATVYDMALARFRPDGTFDTSLAADFHGFGDEGYALAIDPQGRIVAAGTAFEIMRANL